MKETHLFQSFTKLINRKKFIVKNLKSHAFMFCAFLGIFTINSACASTSETAKTEEPYPTTTTAPPPTPSISVTTTTTTSAPIFIIPNEGENFEAVIELCDLASNSLQCEEECFASDSNLENCVAEAEEITDASEPENKSELDPSETQTSETSTATTLGDIDTSDVVSSFLGSYILTDDEFGTQVTVTVSESVRAISSNALANHATGDFPNLGNPNAISEQSTSYVFTTEPVYTGSATEVLTIGVAINGVKFEPGTAESVSCASGEFYRIEALQETYNLGLDLNNAHVQPTGEYHYHGVSQLLVDAFSTDVDLVHLGFAADGFLIYYSKSGSYESGYKLKNTQRTGTGCLATGPAGGNTVEINGTIPDGTYTSDWIHEDADGKLDACNGITINDEYKYFLTESFPYIPRCLNGEVSDAAPVGGPPVGVRPGSGPPPDLTFVAESLGVDLSELMSALGPPPPDLEAAALKLDVSLSELQSLMPRPG